MAVTSIPAAGQAPNWRCTRCELAFYDPTDSRPCPRCKADDALEEAAPAPAQTSASAKGKASARRSLIAWDRVPAFLLGMLLLALWWAFGAKYTIDGLPLLINLFTGWFHIPARLAPVTDGIWYLRLGWLPILISFVERQYQPWRRRDILSRKAYWLPLVWLVVIGVDFGSTYLAILSPAADAWPLTITVATTIPLAVGWSLLTTFGPESGLSWFWRWLRSA